MLEIIIYLFVVLSNPSQDVAKDNFDKSNNVLNIEQIKTNQNEATFGDNIRDLFGTSASALSKN